MNKELQQFQNLKIRLEEIKKATNNFDHEKNYIGGGGFGKVYKGEVSHSKGRSTVAIKRLDDSNGQGDAEFLKEIRALSRYEHENLISLLGFCYQEQEAILVYQLASRGSLDKHLNSPDLTWSKRIKICVDAAKGLRHLHDPRGTHQRLIHCDVKGGNILLDDHWNAKIADFGFSVVGPANELHSTVINLAAGTVGYIDPIYHMTNTLTKESDVYSFGVVLFEVLCGRLCFTHSNGRVQQILVPKWKECYEEKKLNDIIFKGKTIQPLDQSVLELFANIAYRCLNETREARPTMEEVVPELENALESQELLENQEFLGEWNKQRSCYEDITKSVEPPLNYKSELELMKLLTEGVFLNGAKTWFSINMKGEHCEMISMAECLGSEFKSGRIKYNSRFPLGTCFSKVGIFNTHVKTQFLSPGVTYTVNLVFKFRYPKVVRNGRQIGLRYKLQGETKDSISYLAYERENGWWICELYQFTCDRRIVDLRILFYGSYLSSIFIETEGIEFRPLGKVDESQPISDSDSDSDSYANANWKEKLPSDYEDIMKWSTDSVQWTTKKEAYSIMRKGFLISDGIWFSLDKNGKKCHMLSAAHVWPGYTGMILPESRFGEALQYDSWNIALEYEVHSQLVSCETTYGIYLVYKLTKDQSRFEVPVEVAARWGLGDKIWYMYLAIPQTPVIRPKADQNTHNPFNIPKLKGLPQQRDDGWMEVQIWEFQTPTTSMELRLIRCDEEEFSGLIIEGIEYRAI